MAVLAVVLMGTVAYRYLKVDRLPPLSYPSVTVTTRYPQASAVDVEQLVSGPIVAVISGGNIDLKKFAELVGAG